MHAWLGRVTLLAAFLVAAPLVAMPAFAQSALGESSRSLLSSLSQMFEAACQIMPESCRLQPVYQELASGISDIQAQCSGGDQGACQSLANWDQSLPGIMQCPAAGTSGSNEALQACRRSETAMGELASRLGLTEELLTATTSALASQQPGAAAPAVPPTEPSTAPTIASKCTNVQIEAMQAAGLDEAQVVAACGPCAKAGDKNGCSAAAGSTSPRPADRVPAQNPAARVGEEHVFTGVWTVERQPTSRRTEPPSPIADQYDMSVMFGMQAQTWQIALNDGKLAITRIIVDERGAATQEPLTVTDVEMDADELRFTINEAKYNQGPLAYLLTNGSYYLKSSGAGLAEGEFVETQDMPSQLGGQGTRFIYEGTVRTIKTQAPAPAGAGSNGLPGLTPDRSSITPTMDPSLCEAAQARHDDCMASAERMDTAVKGAMLATCQSMLAPCGY